MSAVSEQAATPPWIAFSLIQIRTDTVLAGSSAVPFMSDMLCSLLTLPVTCYSLCLLNIASIPW